MAKPAADSCFLRRPEIDAFDAHLWISAHQLIVLNHLILKAELVENRFLEFLGFSSTRVERRLAVRWKRSRRMERAVVLVPGPQPLLYIVTIQ